MDSIQKPMKKRNRVLKGNITQACQNCKKLHRRCDGEKPICTYCKNRGWNCEYPPQQKRGPRTKKTEEQNIISLNDLKESIFDEIMEEVDFLNEDVLTEIDLESIHTMVSMEPEKKSTSLNGDTIMKCLVMFSEFVWPLNPDFSFNISENCFDRWNQLNLSLEEYLVEALNKPVEDLIEDFRYSVIFSHGCMPNGELGKSLSFVEKIEKLIDILFCSKQVQLIPSKAADLVSILNLFSAMNMWHDYFNQSKSSLQAYHLILLYKDQIGNDSVHSTFMSMLCLAQTSKDRSKWLTQLEEMPKTNVLTNVKYSLLSSFFELFFFDDRKSIEESLNEIEDFEKFYTKITVEKYQQLMNLLTNTENQLIDSNLGINSPTTFTLINWTITSIKAILMFKVGLKKEATQIAHSLFEQMKSILEMRQSPLIFGVSFLISLLFFCDSPKVREALQFFHPLTEIYPKAKKIESIFLKKLNEKESQHSSIHQFLPSDDLILLQDEKSFFVVQ